MLVEREAQVAQAEQEAESERFYSAVAQVQVKQMVPPLELMKREQQ